MERRRDEGDSQDPHSAPLAEMASPRAEASTWVATDPSWECLAPSGTDRPQRTQADGPGHRGAASPPQACKAPGPPEGRVSAKSPAWHRGHLPPAPQACKCSCAHRRASPAAVNTNAHTQAGKNNQAAASQLRLPPASPQAPLPSREAPGRDRQGRGAAARAGPPSALCRRGPCTSGHASAGRSLLGQPHCPRGSSAYQCQVPPSRSTSGSQVLGLTRPSRPPQDWTCVPLVQAGLSGTRQDRGKGSPPGDPAQNNARGGTVT